MNSPSLTALYFYGYKVSYDTLLFLGVYLGKDEEYIKRMQMYEDEFYNIALTKLFPEEE